MYHCLSQHRSHGPIFFKVQNETDSDISKIPKTGKQAFEAKYKLVEEDINEIEASFRNNELSRESLVHKFKLNEVELQELEQKFSVFGREALIQKYKLKDSDIRLW